MIETMKGNVMDLQGDGWKVLAGSCLDRLPELADESVDAVVCDPPYELGFMGKSWDSSGIAYDVNVWRECLRVLKPGGHILAFGGSRTWHRLAVAVEDAGFELRDSIAWLYGSGFPKSLDVSKAIDKQRKDNSDWQIVGSWLKEQRETAGFTRKTFAQLLTGHKNDESAAANVSNWENGLAFPTWDRWQELRGLLKFDTKMDSEVWRLNERKGQPGEAWSEREVIGTQKQGKLAVAPGQENDRSQIKLDVTAPATVEAQKWAGWGTALKPAFEPVVVGRKPLRGTVAANVLEYGVGGLNIDGTRIGTDILPSQTRGVFQIGTFENADGNITPERSGRWPSNVILDEHTAQLVDQQSGVSKSPNKPVTQGGKEFGMGGERGRMRDGLGVGYGDSGGASRFFYIAKANKRDRNEGLDELEEASASIMVDREEGSAGMNSPRAGAGRTSGAKNFHPTVKPTDLMRQLIRLVTPPNGIVLDPFTGSGSTGKAAILEGMQFIGCELTPDYLPIIQGRIEWAVEQVKADKVKAETDAAEALF